MSEKNDLIELNELNEPEEVQEQEEIISEPKPAPSFFQKWKKKIKKKIRVTHRKSRSLAYRLGFWVGKFYKVDALKITFASDSRDNLSGNMDFVYRELLSRSIPFTFRFFLKKRIDLVEPYISLFKKGFQFSTSKFIILDDFYPRIYVVELRPEQELIQLWHAVGAFKRFGFSRVGKPGGPKPDSKYHRNYTKAIVSSDEVRKHYAEGFGIDIANVIATGIPRTDVFFDEQYITTKTAEIYEAYPFLKDKKVILFAPTFRGRGQKSAHYNYEAIDIELLHQNFGDEYIFIMRVHPFVKKKMEIPEQFSEFIYDLDSKFDINDLLFVTDILITDYSSVCFEFSLVNRPMIFFAYDLEEYIGARDFYYEFTEFVPGPIAKDTAELVHYIKNAYQSVAIVDEFRTKFFDHFDGESSKRVVDQLIIQELDMGETIRTT